MKKSSEDLILLENGCEESDKVSLAICLPIRCGANLLNRQIKTKRKCKEWSPKETLKNDYFLGRNNANILLCQYVRQNDYFSQPLIPTVLVHSIEVTILYYMKIC